MSQVRIRHSAVHDIVIVISDDIVLQEAAARDHPKADIGLLQRCEYSFPVYVTTGTQDYRKREAGTLSVFPLKNEPVIARKQFLEQCEIAAPLRSHRGELLQLHSADGSSDLQRADIV